MSVQAKKRSQYMSAVIINAEHMAKQHDLSGTNMNLMIKKILLNNIIKPMGRSKMRTGNNMLGRHGAQHGTVCVGVDPIKVL